MTAQTTACAPGARGRRQLLVCSLRSALFAGLWCLFACQGNIAIDPGAGGSTNTPGGGGSSLPPSPDGDDAVPNMLTAAPDARAHGAALTYVQLCSACHGDWGEGQAAPSLWGYKGDRATLVAKIDQDMPPKNPALCTGDCAEQLADYILGTYSEQALKCKGIAPSPRQLRLLNRREYTNTVSTLLGPPASGAGSAGGGSTGGGAPCGTQLFRYPGDASAASVHVAGSFNGWSDSAWPMTYSAGDQAWTLSKALDDGDHEFKYVVRASAGGDAAWHADPVLGGNGTNGNSLLHIDCSMSKAGGAPAVDFTGLPAETKPVAYSFDTSIASVVGLQQLESYFDVAKKVAASIATTSSLVSCDLAADRAGCARSFVASFGKRVFRRPVSGDEVERYATLLAAQADALDGVRAAVTAFLMSPSFLYRSELGAQQPDGTYLLTPHEVASALSYLFTANMPDDELFAAADQGALQSDSEIKTQAERLLKQSVSRGAVSSFILQWLGVIGVGGIQRDAGMYPDFTPTLAQAMLDETRTFAEHVVFEGEGTLNQLLTADYTFANAELARIYGMSGTLGSELTKTPYPDDLRAGVLGHASVLSAFAHSEQTSPVLRGLFVRRQLMCQRFGEPPPEAGAVPVPDPSKSTRERFDMHSQEKCASCHQHIDGLGFGFEHFDSIGKYRDSEGPHAVDAQGQLTGLSTLSDGTSEAFQSPRELSKLLNDSSATHSCVSKQGYRFVRGELDNGLSYCAVKFVRQRYRESGGKILAALLAAVEAVDFRYRY